MEQEKVFGNILNQRQDTKIIYQDFNLTCNCLENLGLVFEFGSKCELFFIDVYSLNGGRNYV